MDIYIPSWGRGDGMFTYFWTHLSLEISEVLCGLTSLMTQRRSHVQTFRNNKVKSKNVFKKPTWLFKKPRAFSKSQPPDRVCHDTLLSGDPLCSSSRSKCITYQEARFSDLQSLSGYARHWILYFWRILTVLEAFGGFLKNEVSDRCQKITNKISERNDFLMSKSG